MSKKKLIMVLLYMEKNKKNQINQIVHEQALTYSTRKQTKLKYVILFNTELKFNLCLK